MTVCLLPHFVVITVLECYLWADTYLGGTRSQQSRKSFLPKKLTMPSMAVRHTGQLWKAFTNILIDTHRLWLMLGRAVAAGLVKTLNSLLHSLAGLLPRLIHRPLRCNSFPPVEFPAPLEPETRAKRSSRHEKLIVSYTAMLMSGGLLGAVMKLVL